MFYKIDNIKIKFDDVTKSNYREVIIKKLHLDENKVKYFSVLKRSLDSRFHVSDGIYYIYSVCFDYPHKLNSKKYKPYVLPKEICAPKINAAPITQPVIVGAGPCGLFCAVYLIDAGLKPTIIEQGKDIQDRLQDVNSFFDGGILNTDSNVQFGLGGAGTFSDGKLTTRIKSPLVRYVLETLVRFGAEKNILFEAKPHLGTDVLRKIITSIKFYLEENGADIRVSSKMTGIIKDEDNCIKKVLVNGKDLIECRELILATGNAARDTYTMLYASGLIFESKSFAVGVRVEHPQDIIDKYIYGKYAHDKKLQPAEYSLSYKDESSRGVYTFCNCPGGYVINSSTEKNGVCINGMSFSSRDAQNANSAIVVSVSSDDYSGNSPLSGMEFQRELEQKAYAAAGAKHFAPVANISDLLGLDSGYHCEPTIKPGYTYCDFSAILPEFIITPLKNALLHFSQKISGFESGVMTGVETRTSSPLRIKRDETTLQSVNIEGIYPAGEGCGYAGGIMSSAVDGIKVAAKIIDKYMR